MKTTKGNFQMDVSNLVDIITTLTVEGGVVSLPTVPKDVLDIVELGQLTMRRKVIEFSDNTMELTSEFIDTILSELLLDEMEVLRVLLRLEYAVARNKPCCWMSLLLWKEGKFTKIGHELIKRELRKDKDEKIQP